MKYLLTMNVIGQVPIIDLSETEYLSIKKARNILTSGLAMEEKYDLVVSNYMDFETTLLDWAVTSMIKGQYTHDTFFRLQADLNKRIVNLLTASRMYMDQLPRHVAIALPGNQDIKREVRSLFAKEEDRCFEFRFLKELRNSVQHFGFAIHWTQFHGGWDGFKENDNLLFSVEVGSDKTKLREDGGFEKSVLEEAPAKVDLKQTFRKYVEGISRVHDSARKLVDQSVQNARSVTEDMIERYHKELSDEVAGLFAYCLSDEDEELEKVPVILKWDEFRLQLIKDNPFLVNLPKRYVSSRLRPIS